MVSRAALDHPSSRRSQDGDRRRTRLPPVEFNGKTRRRSTKKLRSAWFPGCWISERPTVFSFYLPLCGSVGIGGRRNHLSVPPRNCSRGTLPHIENSRARPRCTECARSVILPNRAQNPRELPSPGACIERTYLIRSARRLGNETGFPARRLEGSIGDTGRRMLGSDGLLPTACVGTVAWGCVAPEGRGEVGQLRSDGE